MAEVKEVSQVMFELGTPRQELDRIQFCEVMNELGADVVENSTPIKVKAKKKSQIAPTMKAIGKTSVDVAKKVEKGIVTAVDVVDRTAEALGKVGDRMADVGERYVSNWEVQNVEEEKERKKGKG